MQRSYIPVFPTRIFEIMYILLFYVAFERNAILRLLFFIQLFKQCENESNNLHFKI
jgi:hypothetical protein